MQQLAVGHTGLDAVTQCVPQVQKGSHAAGFLFVFLNYTGFDGDVVGNDAREPFDGVEGKAQIYFIGQASQGLQHTRLADGGVLNHLGHTFTQYSRRQGEQGGGVGHNESRLVEGADEVLAPGDVNRRFTAH